MNFTFWLAIGLGIILVSYSGRVMYTRYMKRVSKAATKFGKAWGKTTSRYRVLRILNSFFYILGMSIALVGLALGAATLFQPDIEVTVPVVKIRQPDDKLEINRIFQLVNEQRVQQGLTPLIENPRLTAIAQARVDDMATNQYYAHKDPEGRYYYDLLTSKGFNADYSCENLNVEFTTDEWAYVNDWLQSTKGHKECMLDKRITQAGYAVALFGGSDDIYVVAGIHATELKPTSKTKTN